MPRQAGLLGVESEWQAVGTNIQCRTFPISELRVCVALLHSVVVSFLFSSVPRGRGRNVRSLVDFFEVFPNTVHIPKARQQQGPGEAKARQQRQSTCVDSAETRRQCERRPGFSTKVVQWLCMGGEAHTQLCIPGTIAYTEEPPNMEYTALDLDRPSSVYLVHSEFRGMPQAKPQSVVYTAEVLAFFRMMCSPPTPREPLGLPVW